MEAADAFDPDADWVYLTTKWVLVKEIKVVPLDENPPAVNPDLHPENLDAAAENLDACTAADAATATNITAADPATNKPEPEHYSIASDDEENPFSQMQADSLAEWRGWGQRTPHRHFSTSSSSSSWRRSQQFWNSNSWSSSTRYQ